VLCALVSHKQYDAHDNNGENTIPGQEHGEMQILKLFGRNSDEADPKDGA